MLSILLIIFLQLKYSFSNDPLLIASPYPFNTSKSSRIQCFSNDQGIILSLTIVATMLDINQNNPSLQTSENNITKNGSVILTIPTAFNYSELNSKIECRSKYHHGQQKTSQLDVLAVVEIPQNELVSMNINTKQIAIIHCRTYGTNVFITWSFSKDIGKDQFGPLPIGIHISDKYNINDTLIIDHVSYSDHKGYYQCLATNKLLGIIYEDKNVIHLNVKKNTIWISILIVCAVIGLCILVLIFCSRYCQKKRNNQIQVEYTPQDSEEMIEKIKEIIPNRKSVEFLSDYDKENIKESKSHQEDSDSLSHTEDSIKSIVSLRLADIKQQPVLLLNSSSSLRTSPQFVLSNPFLDPNVQSVTTIKLHNHRPK